jgi:hypothetical protein
MIMSVSTLIIFKGAATPSSTVNFCMVCFSWTGRTFNAAGKALEAL